MLKGTALDIIQTFQLKAIWSLDISWDDQILVAGTETGTIELHNFQKIINAAPKAVAESNPKGPSFIKMFQTKARSNGILMTKFTWRNFLYTVGVYN